MKAQQALFPSIEVGKVYELDGELYRCEEVKYNDFGWFQLIDGDGNPITKYYGTFFEDGRRIIYERVNELKLIK